MTLRAQTGAALVMALLLVVVLDCIVLGTLHISMQEHRIGQNRRGVLQLRLDAEGALRTIAGIWPAALDSLGTGDRARLPSTTVSRAHVNVERLGDILFLLEAVAAEPAPRAGRATARLLVHPPVLPREIDPAPAPLSVQGSLRVLATGTVSAASPACPDGVAEHAILLASAGSVVVDPGGVVDAPRGLLSSPALSSEFARVSTLSLGPAAVHSMVGDTVLSQPIAGVLIVDGSLTLQPPAYIEGLLLVRGDLTVAEGSVVTGAVHVGGSAIVAGEIRWDPCRVKRVVDAARFRSAVAVGGRARIPSFGG